MILLASLVAAQLAPGCRRLDQAIRCELAPPVRVSPPPLAVAEPPRPAHRPTPPRPSPRSSAKAPASAPARVQTAAEITRHAGALVTIGDCTGARTYLAAARDAAAADALYRACIGLPPLPSGGDLGAVPGEAAPALRGAETVEHPH